MSDDLYRNLFREALQRLERKHGARNVGVGGRFRDDDGRRVWIPFAVFREGEVLALVEIGNPDLHRRRQLECVAARYRARLYLVNDAGEAVAAA